MALQEAISTHPSYATAHENIGDIYAKMASQAYNQALQLDEGNTTAREKLSLIGELFSAPTPMATQQVEVKSKENTSAQSKETIASEELLTEKKVMAALSPIPASKDDKMEHDNLLKMAVIDAVNEWADAWSKQDVDTYLAYYAKNFIPPHGMSRSAWERLREERLSKPKFISVDVLKPVVSLHGNEHAQVNFSQDYQSDTYKDQVNKSLLMQNVNGHWLIVEEQSR